MLISAYLKVKLLARFFSVVIILLLVILFYISTFQLFKIDKNKIFLINITSDSIIPSYLEIPLNTKIAFINKTNNSVWIASDDHPTHQIYPEFDSRGNIDSGAKWEFLFDKTGRFGYHDHLNPILKGTIVVFQAGDSSSNSSNDNDSQKKIFVTGEIKKIAEETDPVEAWNFYRKNYKNTDFFGAHDIAHYLGALIYDHKGLEGIDNCDSSFVFGCYHGFIENFIVDKKLGDLNALVKRCNKYDLSKGRATCYHGIGHGILSYLKYDLLLALRSCEEILKPNYVDLCWNGVFMENVIGVTAGDYLKKDLHWPCAGLESKFKQSCYFYQSQFFQHKFGLDVDKISEECIGLEIQEYRDSCIKGLSYLITHRYINDPDKIVNECNKIAERLYKDLCILHSAEEFVFQGNSYQIANDKFCELLHADINDSCIKRIKARESQFN